MTMTHCILHNPTTGSLVELSVNDVLEIRLRQIGGDGYRWGIAEKPGVLHFADQRLDTHTLDFPGAAADLILIFHAVSPGRGRLRLDLARQGENTPLESITVELRVGG